MSKCVAAQSAPDLNLIEEFFAKLKAFSRRKWSNYADAPEQDFGEFLNDALMLLGDKRKVREATSDVQE